MKINYKSDFEFDYTLLDEHGQATTPPDFPWKLVLSVGNPLKPYVGQCGCANGRNFVAEYDGENYHNCRVQDNVIRVFVDNHGLPCGQLWATFITYEPDDYYGDDEHRVYTPQPTDVELVSGAGDDATAAQISVTANYVLYDAYYIAAQNGYKGTPEAYYAALVALPTAIGQAVAAAELAEQAKRDALEASSRATQAASAAEGAVRDANTATETANAAAATANRASETAGNAATTANNAASAANSAAESATQVATTIQRQYDETMIVMNNQINELIDGKAQIAQALTDRGYPTQATDSSASMAQKIENMSYDAGWLAQLGYTEQNDGGVKDAVAYSKAIKDGWNPSDTTRKFTNDTKLVYFPVVDLSQYTDLSSMFYGCSGLSAFPQISIGQNISSCSRMFGNCISLFYLPKMDTSNWTNFGEFLYMSYIEKAEEVSFKNSGNQTSERIFNGETGKNGRMQYLLIKDIGYLSGCTSLTCNRTLYNWGNYTEENRMSLVNSLLTYSYDRATANYSTCTIQLHADTLTRLTAEEIAAITAKGFTLTS